MSIQVYWAINMFIKLSPFHSYGNNLKFSIKKFKKKKFFFRGFLFFGRGKNSAIFGGEGAVKRRLT